MQKALKQVVDSLLECRASGRLSNHAWKAATESITNLSKVLNSTEGGIDLSQLAMANARSSLQECIATGLLGSHLEHSANKSIAALDQYIHSLGKLREYFHIVVNEALGDLNYEHHFIFSSPVGIDPKACAEIVAQTWGDDDMVQPEPGETAPSITVSVLKPIPDFLVAQLSKVLPTLIYEELQQVGSLH